MREPDRSGLVDNSTNKVDPNRRPSREFLEALQAVRRPLLLAHVTPDADAVGGMLALATAMREHGIEAVVGLPVRTLAAKLQFMLDFVPQMPLADQWTADGRHDSAIVLDTAGEKRINIQPPLDLSGSLPVFNIDHHITNTDFGAYNWVDPHATSTSEMVARLIGELGWSFSTEVASLLYAGIHGDTAGFSLPSTSAGSLRVAAELVQAGADVGHIGEQLCRSQNRSDFELLRRVYDHTKVVDEGQIAYSFLSYPDISGAGCKADDIDDQVSIPRALKGVRIALLFSEGEPGVIRVNLRGEGCVTVVEIAKKFGGGGHAQAAGVRFHGKTMEEAIREVLAAAMERLRALDAQ